MQGADEREMHSVEDVKNGISGLERIATVERTQAKQQKFKHKRVSDSVRRGYSARYNSRKYLLDQAVFMELKLSSRLPPALRDGDFESRAFFLAVHLCSTFQPDEHRANLFFNVQKVKFLPKIVCAREAKKQK